MTKQLSKFSISLFCFSILLYGLHYGIGKFLVNNPSSYLDNWQTYLFLALITLLGYCFLLFVYSRDATKTGYTYMGIGFLKMLASVLYLYPMISAKPDSIMYEVFSFFIPYFLFIAFELYFVIQLLTKR